MSHNFRDLSGIRFYRLTVINKTVSASGRIAWNCECDCGGKAVVLTSNLTRGHTKSCGCIQRERTGDAHKRHGKTKTRAYSTWQNMLNRCRNENVRSYKNYGGRGITVCERWHTFENFIDDMGYPSKDQSIERKNVSLGYFKENCVWADAVTQANNTRKNRFLSFCGETKTIAQWAREFGISPGRIHLRLSAGWSVENAILTPVRKMKRKSEWQTAQQT